MTTLCQVLYLYNPWSLVMISSYFQCVLVNRARNNAHFLYVWLEWEHWMAWICFVSKGPKFKNEVSVTEDLVIGMTELKEAFSR